MMEFDLHLPRRGFVRRLGAFAAATVVASPYLNRFALGQAATIRLAQVAQISAAERGAWDTFVEEVQTASNGTIALSLAVPTGLRIEDVLQSVASRKYDGVYGSATNLLGRYRIYDPPEPGFSLIGNTLAAFDNCEQQGAWFELGGGNEVADFVYASIPHAIQGGRLLTLMGILPFYSAHLIVNRPVTSFDELRGLRVELQRGFTADLLAYAGVGPRFTDVPITPHAAVVGRLTASRSIPHPTEYVLKNSFRMETRDISIARDTTSHMTTDQVEFLRRSVRRYASSLRTDAARREEQWFADLPGHGVSVVEWNPSERAELKLRTNRFLREWSTRGRPAPGVMSSRDRIVDSLEEFQRIIQIIP